MPRLLDLFCGRWGWSRAFAARGWRCTGVDLTEPSEIPVNCAFIKRDVLDIGEAVQDPIWLGCFDFIVASSPCEEFSIHMMKHFHKNPKYPEHGIKLFNHTREILEASGVPYVMENVRAAQLFVGNAVHHCGPYFLWGSGVPPLVPKGRELKKGLTSTAKEYYEAAQRGQAAINELRKRYPHSYSGKGSKMRTELTAKAATIPPLLANCVADYAERLLEQRACA
jgi:hypothetical protein